jgi:hypothetical protein
MLSNPKGCFRVGSRVGLRLGLGLVFCSLVLVLPGRAQRVDVPLFDAQGNFRSTRVQGHRGVDQQIYWLVVDRDPAGLNCWPFRSGDRPEVSLQYGAIVGVKINGVDDDAISIQNGQAWLRITADQSVFQRDDRGPVTTRTYQ